MNDQNPEPNLEHRDQTPVKTDWKIRRRIIYFTLMFCLFEIVYLTVFAQSTELNETLANGTLLLAGSVIGSYVFGAVWDDRNLSKHSSDTRRR